MYRSSNPFVNECGAFLVTVAVSPVVLVALAVDSGSLLVK